MLTITTIGRETRVSALKNHFVAVANHTSKMPPTIGKRVNGVWTIVSKIKKRT